MGKGKQTTIFNYEVDEEKTFKAVKKFFKYDYPAIKRLARRDPTGISSPSITGMPSGDPDGNPTENRLVNWVDARQAEQATADAIKYCSRDSRKILKLWGLQGNVDNDRAVIDQIYYGESWYYEHRKTAVLEFAEAYPLANLLKFKEK